MQKSIGSVKGDHAFARLLVVTALALWAVQGLRPAVSYRALELGAGPAELGVVAASFSVLSVLFVLPLGRAIDRYGERRFLVSGCAMVVAAAAALPALTSVFGLIVDQALLGFGYLLVVLAGQALVANTSPSGQREGRFGLYAMFGGLGALTGPLLLAVLVGPADAGSTSGPVDPKSLNAVFLAAAVLGLGAMLVSLGIRTRGHVDPQSVAEGYSRGEAGDASAIRAGGPMVTAMLTSVAVLVSSDLIVVYLPAYADQRRIPVYVVGILLALKAGASMLSRLVMGRLTRFMGARGLLVGSMLIASAGLMLVPLVDLPPVLAVLMVLVGFGLGIGQPLTMAWVANESPPDRRGRAMALRLTGNRLGQLVLLAAAGALAGVAGIGAIFWASTGMLLGVAGLVARINPVRVNHTEEEHLGE